MSKIIRANSELLLYALKYSVSSNDTEKEIVINNIYANIDNLNNEDLYSYLETIETDEIKNSCDNIWPDFKTTIEKELSVRADVKRLVDAFKKIR